MPSQPLLEAARPASAPVLQIRIPVRLIGAILLGLVAIVLVALASWSVDDPSLSYATANPAQNWLGFPGAVIADIIFQVFGLSILVALIPLAVWGWNFVRRAVPNRIGWRVLAWLLATLLGAGILSFIAVPESWPLPLGLGGLIGSGFYGLASMITGAHPQPVTAWLFALIMAAPALVLFWIALGLGTVPATFGGRSATARSRAAAAADEDRPERDSVLSVVIGGVVHLAFSAQSALRRAIESAKERRETEATDWRSEEEPTLERRYAAARSTAGTEPQVNQRRIAAAADQDEVEDEGLDEPEDEVAVSPRGRAPQVTPRAARPKPGTRAAREAQPSLLEEEDGFELPPLKLLAEAKHKGPSPELAPERLEAMARRLESVLEDFGVKGDIINVRPGPVVTLFELEPAPGIKSSPRDLACRRHRPLDERDLGARRGRSRPQRHRHRAAQRAS